MAGEQLFQFQAGGEACDICAAMDGQVSEVEIDLPHEACLCQVVPLNAGDDCPTYQWEHVHTERYGPGGESALLTLELEVTCCDGTTIGESLQVDMGIEPGDREIGEDIAEVDAAADAAAQSLADGCPPPEEFLCC